MPGPIISSRKAVALFACVGLSFPGTVALLNFDETRTHRRGEPDSNLYGAFPVKQSFWFVVGSLFGAGKPFFVPSLRSGSRSAQKGVKGPKR